MSLLVQLPPRNVPFLDPRTGTVSDAWYRFLGSLVTRAGGISGALQPEDPTLTALAAMDASVGVVVETAPDVFTKRAGLTGTKSPINSLTLQNGVVTAWS